MKTKPSISELTPEEISEVHRKLDERPAKGGPSWIERLREVQEEVTKILENKIVGEGTLLHSRKQVKTPTSIIEKINTHRRSGESTYGITNLDDLIGAQMLCPYLDDVDRVLNWLYDRQGGRKYFQLVTRRKTSEKEMQEREKRTGYRGYHICLKLKKGVAPKLPSGSESDKFELQIKTILEASWAGKTHDVIYKNKDIDPNLLEHMRFFSHSLNAIDEQTKLLRYQIKEDKNARHELRRAAILLFFYISLNDKEKRQLGIDKDISDWQQKDVKKFEESMKKCENSFLCSLGFGLLALYDADRYKEEQALAYASLATKRAKDEPNLHKALRLRAQLRWAFHQIRPALYDLNYCLKHFNDNRTIWDKNDFVYYICELYEIDSSDLNKARLYVTELEKAHKKSTYLDTIGAFYVRFAKDKDELAKGLTKFQEAAQIKKSAKDEKVSQAFRRYSEYLATRQLARLLRGM
jgi:ppGpp synthetase/RelA/SpoT-type nucleotidyltranferase